MTRPGYSPYAQERRDCPRCRYPMLRAEKLGGVSDQVGAFNPQESWLPALAYQVPLGLLAASVSLRLSSGLAWLYSFLLNWTHWSGALWLAGLLVLISELALIRHVMHWAGWRQKLRDWTSGAPRATHGVWQNEKAWTSIKRRRNDSGLSLLPLLWLGSLPVLAMQLAPLLSQERIGHDTVLTTLLVTTGLLVCVLLTLGLPVFYDDARKKASLMRRQRRQKLVRELAPDDWICPNCLYTAASHSG